MHPLSVVLHFNNILQLLSNYERFYTAEQAALNAQKHHRNDIYVSGMNDACNYSAYHETAYLEAGNETDMLWENTWMAKYYGLSLSGQ